MFFSHVYIYSMVCMYNVGADIRDNFACIIHVHSTTEAPHISAIQIGDLMRSFKLLLYKAEKGAFEEVYDMYMCIFYPN